MQCTLHNDTDAVLGRAWEFVLQFQEEGSAEGCYGVTNPPRCEPGEPTLVEFRQAVVAGTCVIKLQAAGYVLMPGAVRELVVEAGGEYRIQVDPANKPLTQQEAEQVIPLVVAALESGGDAVPGGTGGGDVALWGWVSQQLGREGGEPLVLQRMFVQFMCGHAYRKPPWYQAYAESARRRAVAAAGDARAALAAGQYELVVYHRALERFPGGNCDAIVMKHHFDGGAARVGGRLFRNWDGSAELWGIADVGEAEEYPQLAAKQLVAGLVPKLHALLAEQPGAREHLCTVDEPRSDSDEYNTVWSSVEVLLFGASAARAVFGGAAAAEAGPLLLRVHQVARYTRDHLYMKWADAGPETMPDAPARPSVAAVVEAATAAVDALTPNEFSEGDATASQAFNVEIPVGVKDTCSVMPLHL
jgi:hypothetical protein